MVKNILLYSSLLFISGCGFSHHQGNSKLTAENVALIKIKVSTKTDVLTALGPPQTTQKKTPDSANYPPGITPSPMALASEIWTYWSQTIKGEAVVMPFYASTTTSGGNTIYSVYFNESGTVIDTSIMQTNY